MTAKASSGMKVAVIGSGMAGIACARSLVEAGRTVVVYDKGHRPGGRLATRRVTLPDGRTIHFDHGAQFATARDQAFETALSDAGCLTWDRDRQIGNPGMRDIAVTLATGLSLHQNADVIQIVRPSDGWYLVLRDGATVGPFAHIVCTIPPVQAVRLFPSASTLLATVRMASCWAIMLAFTRRWQAPFDLWQEGGVTSVLGWAARDSAKPGRSPEPDRWILHAGPEWSDAHLEEAPQTVLGELTSALATLSDSPLPEALYAAAHRWRYARTILPLGEACLPIHDGEIILAGDWCLGNRIESAFLSGRAAAKTLLGAGE